ncbi:protein O-glucosyltransferase 2-like [Euwallacea fornicatus]|uniref:protein O-glucosyltransferase 2-like n=1 Tax=Euwallacea fornicatus TaxID=995702 RepID=UPI00338E7396
MNKARVKMKEIITFSFVLSCFISSNPGKAKIDTKLPTVWGPGLEPHKVVMSARYFFIKVPTQINESIQDDFEIVIHGGTSQNKSCRIWSNVLDRKDGSLIVRYKVYETCTHIKISIKYKNQHIGQSPYIIKEVIYPEDCYCPVESITKFLQTWQCETVPRQIVKNFGFFKSIDWEEMRPKVIKQFDKPHAVSICHYVIKNNKINRKCYGKHVGFNMFSDSILLSLTRKAKVPDTEFFVNLGDWPLSKHDLPEKYPIFSWCGSMDSYDIIMPTYELTEASIENMGRVMLDMLSVQGNVAETFNNREPKLFWRGRDSNRGRLNLITLSRDNPDLFNVSLTNFFFFRDEEDIYGPKTDHVSFFKFFDYKYQLAIDGTVAPYRTPFLLAGGSLVFKPHSKYYEYFYHDLEPLIHYIPVKSDLSDLVEKLIWAKNNNDKAQVIVQNGQTFANNNLLPQHIFCYYAHLLNELSKAITSKIKVLEDMEVVNQKKNIQCDCLRLKEYSKDEL